MTGAVVDASIIVEATVGQGTARVTARAALRQSLAAPELLDLEVASALRRAVHQRRLEINNFSTYDASYVALAEALGIPLVTADRRLARAAERYCAVVLVD